MEFIIIGLLVVIIGLLVSQRGIKIPKTSVTKNRAVILDTCALIDGRIIELAKAGFVPDELIVPQFIVNELQMLADGGDSHKRERARYGLDVVKELQDSNYCTVTIDHTSFPDISQIDDKLVALAKKIGAQLYTTDFNLNKVASIESVRVLNVNELAQHIRPVALPGEKKTVKILQRGNNRDQGVGYLEDGTMVVVDGAARLIGKPVEVEVSRVHQTIAGKMLFGQLVTVKRPNRRAPLQRTK